MSPEEFEQEQTKKPARQTTCDPCRVAGVTRVPRRRLGYGSESLDETRCIMVDEDGFAQFMVLTDDGRWVKAEEY